MTQDDPIVDEARNAGRSYVDSFGGDWSALVADLRRRAQTAGRKPITLPPQPLPKPSTIVEATKKVG